jgi:hypothetical protein
MSEMRVEWRRLSRRIDSEDMIIFRDCRVRVDTSGRWARRAGAPPKVSPRGHRFRGLKKLNLVDRVDPDLKRALATMSGA